ncbi:MAG: histidine kinase [Candidatus Accumulibacter sp. 66-26]|nr:HAMP domain-containing histidine kinase [Accumulibacter sp.]OJW48124.1 MAG: histidine kinase [Candidatus Accumulibacter sp. 66-26]
MMPHSTDDELPQVDITTFLASSAHDMKNSVSLLIRGLEQILATTDAQAFPGHQNLAQMTYEAKRINSNLIQLLTLYKVGQQIYPFDPQSVSLADFLHNVAAQNTELLRSQGVALECECPSDLYWELDEDLITGVISNAFTNAIHYTRDRVRLTAAEVDGKLELRIEDNGQGYPPRMLRESIDSMRGVDFQGGSTGLGLFFSATAARLHRHGGRGGEVKLENGGPLGGGCFILRLP